MSNKLTMVNKIIFYLLSIILCTAADLLEADKKYIKNCNDCGILPYQLKRAQQKPRPFIFALYPLKKASSQSLSLIHI